MLRSQKQHLRNEKQRKKQRQYQSTKQLVQVKKEMEKEEADKTEQYGGGVLENNNNL